MPPTGTVAIVGMNQFKPTGETGRQVASRVAQDVLAAAAPDHHVGCDVPFVDDATIGTLAGIVRRRWRHVGPSDHDHEIRLGIGT